MGKIRPTLAYMSAWNAVNEANSSNVVSGSVTAVGKQRSGSSPEEGGCRFEKRGLLKQVWHNITWLVSPGYRERKSAERGRLLDMMENEIRANCGTAQSGLRSVRSEESDDLTGRDFEVQGTESENEDSPKTLPKSVEEALGYAREHLRDRQTFIDALHRVFLEAAGSLVNDEKNSLTSREVGSQSLAGADIGPADRNGSPSEEAGSGTVGDALSAALMNEELKLKKCRKRVPPEYFAGCMIPPQSQGPRESHSARLGWQIQFKIKNRLSDAEMAAILDSIAKNGEQLSVAGQCRSSEEFLGAMKDISASAATTYEALSKNVSRGKRRCRDPQTFLAVYVRALCAAAAQGNEEKMDSCGTLTDVLRKRQDDFRAAEAAYAVTAAKAKSGLTLSFAATDKIANRKELKQALNVTSLVRKALGLEFLRTKTPKNALTDAEVLRLINSGIAIRGRKVDNAKGSIRVFPDQTIARITKEVSTLGGCAPYKNTGICGEMYFDLERQGMKFGDLRIAPDADGNFVTDRELLLPQLEDFCRDDRTRTLDKNMMMAISQVMLQGFVACLLGEIDYTMPLHPTIHPDSRENDLDFLLEKDENEDVFIELILVQEGKYFMRESDENGAPLLGSVTNSGHIGADDRLYRRCSVKVKIAKENYSKDGGMYPKPQLVDICYDYDYKMS